MKLLHVCFDLDGVIFDSKQTMNLAWTLSSQSLGIDIDFDRYFELIGVPQELIFQKLEIEEHIWARLKAKYIEVSNSNPPKMFDGVEHLLKTVTDRFGGYSVVTSKSALSATPLLRTLSFQPNLLLTPESGLKAKPFPDQLLEVARVCNISSSSLAYVGDTSVDEQAATSAGALFFGANWGFGKFFRDPITFNNPTDLSDMLADAPQQRVGLPTDLPLR